MAMQNHIKRIQQMNYFSHSCGSHSEEFIPSCNLILISLTIGEEELNFPVGGRRAVGTVSPVVRIVVGVPEARPQGRGCLLSSHRHFRGAQHLAPVRDGVLP